MLIGNNFWSLFKLTENYSTTLSAIYVSILRKHILSDIVYKMILMDY